MAKPRRLVEYKTSRNSCKKCNTNLRYKNGNCVQCLLNREQQNRENIPYYNKVKEKAKTRYYNDVELSRAKLRENRNRNKEEINLNRRIQYKENPEPKRLAIYKWRKTNPNKQKEIQLRYDNLNKEKRKALAKRLKPRYKESIKIASKRHYINNKYLYVEKSRRRAATKLQATPSWINIDKIREVYKEAQKTKMSVDHIVPLIGKINGKIVVCGLHCEANLQIMSIEDNKRKGHTLWPDMPDKE